MINLINIQWFEEQEWKFIWLELILGYKKWYVMRIVYKFDIMIKKEEWKL